MVIKQVTINNQPHWSVRFNGEYWNTPIVKGSLKGLLAIIYSTYA